VGGNTVVLGVSKRLVLVQHRLLLGIDTEKKDEIFNN
jgi:hypothetical protein